jgi:toxin CcdB
MARLDVYAMPGRGGVGYVVDVQAELLSALATRTVVPLLPLANTPAPIKELNPVFDIDAGPHVMLTQSIATVPVRELRARVASLAHEQDAVTRALDILLHGF